MERLSRTTARVLPVSPDGAVLLLQEQDPARPGVTWWGTIGGAVDAGEAPVDAAVRELLEETGLVVSAGLLTGPIGTGVHEYSFAGVDYVGHSSFFAVALDRDVEISFDNLQPDEVGNVLAAAWWHPDDLETDGGAAQPDMPQVMRRAIVAVRGQA